MLLLLLGADICVDVAAANPIIGGQGKFRYQFMPNLLQIPAGAQPLLAARTAGLVLPGP